MEEPKPKEEVVSAIRRREAKSGHVSYADPVILHETSKSRLVMVPFFVKRTSGTELPIKIISYTKAMGGLVPVEEKSVPIPADAARKLLRGLKDHLRIAEENADGSYMLIKVADGVAELGEHDPSAVAAALAKVMSQPEILSHLEGTELTEELLGAFRTAIRLSEMRSAVAQLRRHLDEGEFDESVYQGWCERHSWAFGNAYVMRDEVREISAGDKLDMLLPAVITGYRDIVELKRPDDKVLLYDTQHRNFYFAAPASKAIGQCHRYLDVLHEEAATGLRDHPEIVAYHPRAIIVIGRSEGWPDDMLRALHGLNERLVSIRVMTYDMLLAQGERLLDMLTSERRGQKEEQEEILEEHLTELDAAAVGDFEEEESRTETVKIDDDDPPF